MAKIFKSIMSIFSPAAMVAKTVSMPDPGSATAKIAATKKVQERKKSGREGTIFTGGGAYTGANLGGTA